MNETVTRNRHLGILISLFLLVTASGCANGAVHALAEDASIMDIAMDILGDAYVEQAPAAATAAPVTAAPAEEAANTFRFSVSPVLPSNQVDAGVGYFYLKMTPGQKQTIEIAVRNDGTEPVTIAVTPTAAITNGNGIMQYGKSDITPDPSLPYLITDLMTLSQERLSLQAKETQTVRVTIEMPAEPYDGTLLGGLVFLREQAEEARGAEGTVISNLFSYVMPVRLIETDAPIKAAFALADITANTQTAFGPRTIVTVRNTQPVIVKPMTLAYTLYAAGDLQTPLMEHTNEQVEMAPNTAMPYTLRQAAALEPGDYVAHITITYQGETTSFEKAFTVAES